MENLSKPRRYLAFVRGARSAFDLSGFGMLREDLFRSPAWRSADPAGAIAQDMGRVMESLGRSTRCAQRALDAGIEIEQLKPGCTIHAMPLEAQKLSTRHSGHTQDTATHSRARR